MRDVNKDGNPDVLVANGESDSISVLLGNGKGAFTTAGKDIHFQMNAGPVVVTVVDVNKDGRPDIIVANKGLNSVSVLLGNADGSFTEKGPFATNPLPLALTVADMNGDGVLDIVVASGADLNAFVSVLIGKGDGTFPTRSDTPTDGFPGAVAVGDVDKDGKPDIVATSGSQSTANVFLNQGVKQGQLTFQDSGNPIELGLPGMVTPVALAVVDLDHDGKPDIVAADSSTNQVFVLLNQGGGTFQAPAVTDPFPMVGATPQGLAVADVTGDGELDIVTVGLDAQAISVLAGKGDGTFSPKVDTPVGSMPAALAVADVDRNGVPDIIVTDQDTSMGIVLLGQCTP